MKIRNIHGVISTYWCCKMTSGWSSWAAQASLSHFSLHRVTDIRALGNNSSGVSSLFLFQSSWRVCGLYTGFK
jgi:hypothetical protein